MNNRGRFLRIMNYEPVDSLPVLAVEPFETTAIERWPLHIPLSFGGLKGRWSRKMRSTWSKRRIWVHSCVCFDFYLEVKSKLRFRRKENPTMFYGHIDHPVKTHMPRGAPIRYPLKSFCRGISHL